MITDEFAELEVRGLGRAYAPDPRDRLYRIAGLGPLAKRYTSKGWTTGPILDQGDTSECVRYGTTQLLATRPVVRSHALDRTAQLYAWAQANDGIPMPHDGTTVRAGLQYARKVMGLIESFSWAMSMDEALSWLSRNGPLVVGTEWLTGMDVPDANGFITPEGESRGGHCYAITRLDARNASVSKQRVQMTNSWGESWGLSGKAWLTLDAFEYLIFGANGEAAAVTEKAGR